MHFGVYSYCAQKSPTKLIFWVQVSNKNWCGSHFQISTTISPKKITQQVINIESSWIHGYLGYNTSLQVINCKFCKMAIHSFIDLKKMFYASPSAPIQILVQAMTQNYFTSLFTNLNGGQCKHNLLLSIDVGIQYTQNVLKLLRNYKGLWKQH